MPDILTAEQVARILLQLAARAKAASDAGRPLVVTPAEHDLLRTDPTTWPEPVRSAWRVALARHPILPGPPWEPTLDSTQFWGLPVVIDDETPTPPPPEAT